MVDTDEDLLNIFTKIIRTVARYQLVRIEVEVQRAVGAGFNCITCIAVIEDRFDTSIEASAFRKRIGILRSKRPGVGIILCLILHVGS